MDLRLSSKIEKNIKRKPEKPSIKIPSKGELLAWFKKGISNGEKNGNPLSRWNFLYPVIILSIVFISIFLSLVNLQIVRGEEYYLRSESNQYEVSYITPYRGVVLDREGRKLAENVPSINVAVDLEEYREDDRSIDSEELGDMLDSLDELLNREGRVSDNEGETSVTSKEKVLSTLDYWEENDPGRIFYTHQMDVISGVSNDDAVLIKSRQDEFPGVSVDDGSKRHYPQGEMFSHILGYTGDVFAEDLEDLNYIGPTDSIGRFGVERLYDKRLFGQKGEIAREVDASGNVVTENEIELKQTVSGDSLYLTLDAKAQEKMYETLKDAVKRHGATGGAGILEDVETGEILVLASYPSYDNNDFVGGISEKKFSSLLNDPASPLTNKAISAEAAPGSTFKTIVASAALDAGEITKQTQHLSSSGYTFSDDTPFQEYRGKAYGWLDLIGALSVSSNIYFCEVVRNWDIEELVPYFERFGIGQYTYIDVPGEGAGRLPSPENKIKLARSGYYWLEDVWYPEGDSCNTVIGQGITSVTPIQMANWVAAIANGGTLPQPHVAKEFINPDGDKENIDYEPIRENIVSKSALADVREGMWSTVNGPRRVVVPLTDAKVEVAAKTGTAEFGAVNSEGIYEHTHAWVTGFFPFENPKYSFVVFLEDGGESNNSATVAREFIDWWVDYSSK